MIIAVEISKGIPQGSSLLRSGLRQPLGGVTIGRRCAAESTMHVARAGHDDRPHPPGRPLRAPTTTYPPTKCLAVAAATVSACCAECFHEQPRQLAGHLPDGCRSAVQHDAEQRQHRHVAALASERKLHVRKRIVMTISIFVAPGYWTIAMYSAVSCAHAMCQSNQQTSVGDRSRFAPAAASLARRLIGASECSITAA